jgi:hypothetical protein
VSALMIHCSWSVMSGKLRAERLESKLNKSGSYREWKTKTCPGKSTCLEHINNISPLLRILRLTIPATGTREAATGGNSINGDSGIKENFEAFFRGWSAYYYLFLSGSG